MSVKSLSKTSLRNKILLKSPKSFLTGISKMLIEEVHFTGGSYNKRTSSVISGLESRLRRLMTLGTIKSCRMSRDLLKKQRKRGRREKSESPNSTRTIRFRQLR